MLAVLPTGYGNHQLLPPVLNFISDFMNQEGRSSAKNSTVLVISPLNALIRDLIHLIPKWPPTGKSWGELHENEVIRAKPKRIYSFY